IRLSVAAGGRTLFRYLPLYRGNWLTRSAEVMTEGFALPKEDVEPGALIHRLFKRSISRQLRKEPDQSSDDTDREEQAWKSIHGLLMEHAEIRQGTNAVVRPGGTVRLAWIDPIDNSAQYAMVHLPPEYDAAHAWPLVVDLHGFNPLNPEYAEWPGVHERHHRIAESHNVIVLRPHGRGNVSYEGIGELDVLAALHRTTARFTVDRDRVYLMGDSMGAAGTIHLGSRHPHLFAALGPVVGAGRDYRVRMDPDKLRRLDSRERFRLERRSSYVQADGLATTPVFLNVGDSDEFGFVREARFFVGLLQRWGYDVRYREHPGKGHWGLECEDEVATWLLSHTLKRNPRRVRVRAAQLKSAAAHWVRVRQRSDPFSFIHADARAIDRRTIRLSTDNVLQVTLSPGEDIVDYEDPVRVVWNGAEQEPHRFGDGALTLTSPTYKPADIVKTASREGPIDDLWTTPFAIVVGTMSKDPRVHRLLRSRADALRQSWRDRHHADPRFFIDSEITEKDIRDYSLLLLGGAEENLVTRIFADRLPLTVDGDRITIDGRTFDAPDAAICMVYPHPLNQDRYLLLNTSTSADGLFHIWNAPEDRDFAVVDARGEILSGVFDYRWRFTERYVDYGDAAARLVTPPRKIPHHLSAASGGSELALSDLLELRASGSFLDMRRGEDRNGNPLTLGDREYATGIAVSTHPGGECSAVYDLAAGSWQRMKATVGTLTGSPKSSTGPRTGAAGVRFLVSGDGKELYRSAPFQRDSIPADIDVDVSGVQLLTLRVQGDSAPLDTATTAIWADARLLK
ncbi:MAG: NPCBM/NEW2 domain-containing protein, partial [Lentisphaerae bacterium]|nr:NPCBM/NEW2 domain-containing protein [Lentisphaerota bacterium]